MTSIAYIDESGGTDASGTTFTLAGFVASNEVWPNFSRDWELTRSLPPKTPPVHMTDVSGPGKGGWERLNDGERESRLLQLVDVIVAHDLQGFVVMIDMPKFRSAAKQLTAAQRRQLRFDKPYPPAAIAALRSLTGLETQWGRNLGRIDFVFEEHREFARPVRRNREDELNRLLAAEAPDVLERTGSVRWESKSSQVPLQAADLLAWSVRRARDYPHGYRAVHAAICSRVRVAYYSPANPTVESFFVVPSRRSRQ